MQMLKLIALCGALSLYGTVSSATLTPSQLASVSSVLKGVQTSSKAKPSVTSITLPSIVSSGGKAVKCSAPTADGHTVSGQVFTAEGSGTATKYKCSYTSTMNENSCGDGFYYVIDFQSNGTDGCVPSTGGSTSSSAGAAKAFTCPSGYTLTPQTAGKVDACSKSVSGLLSI
jgi:hypothetical protein